MAAPDPNDTVAHPHYSLRHRVVAWVSQRVFDNVTYTVRHGILSGMRRRGGLGWLPAWIAREQETAEHAYFRSLDLRGKVVFDIGAFVGLFAMHCARQASLVVCYEPMPRTRARLLENLQLNQLQNVRVRPLGMGKAKAVVQLTFDPLMPGGASASAGIADGIRVASSQSVTQQIEVTTVDDEIREEGLPVPDFIKIDIEGLELDALMGAEQTLRSRKPALYLEMHGDTMAEKREKVRAIVEFLTHVGYERIMHVETGLQITMANTDVAAEGHLACP